MKTKVGGNWKDANPYVKVAGAWKEATYAFTKVGGVWKQAFQKYPVVTGGTLTSDATYYYRTFTANDTLTITGDKPLAFDYVLVGGGGGGGEVMKYNYGQCYYSTMIKSCCLDCGNCSQNGWLISCYQDFQGFYYCNGLDVWACGRPNLSLTFDGGGGGAGGVVTGSTVMAPGSANIVIGQGGAGGVYSPYDTPKNGGNTTAFGVTAYGGGAGGGASPSQPGASGGGSGANVSGSISNYPSQGNHGSHLRNAVSGNSSSLGNCGVFVNNIFVNVIATPYVVSFYDYLRYTDANGRMLGQPGWGGGAGKAAHHSDATYDIAPNINNLTYQGAGRPTQIQDAWGDAIKTPAALSDVKWAPLNSNYTYSSLTYDETVGAQGQKSRMAIWDCDFGVGVDVLGLKVGGGGMGGFAARSLTKSYGGGYPMNATTAKGTYSVNGTPNTGGGGGGAMGGYSDNGGAGGSGVVRIRYLRSAVGG
jgi:hypothetical protein